MQLRFTTGIQASTGEFNIYLSIKHPLKQMLTSALVSIEARDLYFRISLLFCMRATKTLAILRFCGSTLEHFILENALRPNSHVLAYSY